MSVGMVATWTPRHTNDRTTGQMPYYTTNVTAIIGSSGSIAQALARPLPAFVPSHQSVAASDAGACAKWAYKFLNVSMLDTKTG